MPLVQHPFLGFDEGDENWDVLDVLLILGVSSPPLQTRGLKERHTRQPSDEKHDKNWRGNCEILPASEDSTAGQVETEPKEYFPKIVGMSRNAPEAGRDELSLVGWVAFEDGLLHVSHHLDEEAKAPNGPTKVVTDAKCRVSLRHVHGDGRYKRDEDPKALNHPVLEEESWVVFNFVKPPVASIPDHPDCKERAQPARPSHDQVA